MLMFRIATGLIAISVVTTVVLTVSLCIVVGTTLRIMVGIMWRERR